MFSEDDLLPISALQHLLFCERQCALIHLEGLWAENRLTVEGRQLHQKAHDGPSQSRAGVRIERGMALHSLRLGLFGFADVVEFHEGRPFPVEYKRGKPKPDRADQVQLCAETLCLEEMMNVSIPVGALFYGQTRRRSEVPIDHELRRVTEETAQRLHDMIRSGRTPIAERQPKCDNCSLLNLCMPPRSLAAAGASRYLRRSMELALQGPPPQDADS